MVQQVIYTAICILSFVAFGTKLTYIKENQYPRTKKVTRGVDYVYLVMWLSFACISLYLGISSGGNE